MTNAVIVPFFHYHGTSKETSQLLFSFFLKHMAIWRDEVDTVYVIDSGDFLPETPGVTLLKTERQSHWQNLNETIGELKEDAFIILDSDTVIYRKGILKEVLTQLEHNHIVSILDNSGNKTVEKQFSFLQPNKRRDYRRRFAPYFFACNTNYFKKIKFDFTPKPAEGYLDSMSEITEQLLAHNPNIRELPDDRTTVYYNDGQNAVTQWLDAPTFKWSAKVSPDYGYYHLRNAGLGLYALDSFRTNKEAWNKIVEITPINEFLRIITWAYHIIPTTPENTISLMSMIHCYNISPLQFEEYLGSFRAAHPWIETL